MYSNLLKTTLLAALVIAGTSCKKNYQPPASSTDRKVQYVLYTDKDFSSDNANITFTLIMKNSTQTIWDSVLAPMKIKDIPSIANKLVFEKAVPGNNNSELTVGFLYEIENVGYSWFLDTIKAGESFKTVNYAFQ